MSVNEHTLIEASTESLKALIMPVQINAKEDLDPDNYCEWIPFGETNGETDGADS